jgi:hypothetical protein
VVDQIEDRLPSPTCSEWDPALTLLEEGPFPTSDTAGAVVPSFRAHKALMEIEIAYLLLLIGTEGCVG